MGNMDRSRAAGSEQESLQPRALQVDNQYSHDDDGDCEDGDCEDEDDRDVYRVVTVIVMTVIVMMVMRIMRIQRLVCCLIVINILVLGKISYLLSKSFLSVVCFRDLKKKVNITIKLIVGM